MSTAATTDALLRSWEALAERLRGGGHVALADYLRGADARQRLQDALLLGEEPLDVGFDQRLQAADERARDHVVSVRRCLHGEDVAHQRGWRATANWWFFAAPVRRGPGLDEAGIGRGHTAR